MRKTSAKQYLYDSLSADTYTRVGLDGVRELFRELEGTGVFKKLSCSELEKLEMFLRHYGEAVRSPRRQSKTETYGEVFDRLEHTLCNLDGEEG